MAGERRHSSSAASVSATRQVTPSDQVGILSNSNVRLDERLDLLEFMESSNEPSDSLSGTTHAAARGDVAARSHMRHYAPPPLSSSLKVAFEAECKAAVEVLQDEVVPRSPWFLQALFCLLFPCIGVEASMRGLSQMVPSSLQALLQKQLDVLDRHSPRSHGNAQNVPR